MTLNLIAYQREAERLRSMAKRAFIYGDAQWAKRWRRMSVDMKRRAVG